MMQNIVPFFLGLIIAVIGISNMRGNISTLHSYHRHRVSEEDRIPFGKKVGLGTIICGCALMVFSVFSAVTFYTNKQIFTFAGTVILIAGLIIGLVITLAAMIKYNKGIF